MNVDDDECFHSYSGSLGKFPSDQFDCVANLPVRPLQIRLKIQKFSQSFREKWREFAGSLLTGSLPWVMASPTSAVQ